MENMDAIERFNKLRDEQAQVNVRFKYDGQYDETLSQEAGRPIFKAIELIEMRFGNETREVLVTPQHKSQFPVAYKAFKSQEEPFKDGTLLKEWSLLPKSTMLELVALGVRTVDELALCDAVPEISGLFPKEIETAKEWIENAKAPKNIATTLGKKIKDMEQLIENYKSQIETLHRQVINQR